MEAMDQTPPRLAEPSVIFQPFDSISSFLDGVAPDSPFSLDLFVPAPSSRIAVRSCSSVNGMESPCRRLSVVVCHDYRNGYHPEDVSLQFQPIEPCAELKEDLAMHPVRLIPRARVPNESAGISEENAACHSRRDACCCMQASEALCPPCPRQDCPPYLPLYLATPGIDAVIYFSHHRISPPPASWVRVCRAHSVRCLGTMLTEWEQGERDLTPVLRCTRLRRQLVSRLAQVAVSGGFDGWLLNVEHEVPVDLVESLVAFVSDLRAAVSAAVGPTGTVLWYDSVLADAVPRRGHDVDASSAAFDPPDGKTGAGQLLWQNELNVGNVRLACAADGIFTNYTWTQGAPRRSAAYSRQVSRPPASFVLHGLDVFGRGSYGGEGIDGVTAAIAEVRRGGTGCALFAPAWTFENAAKSCITGDSVCHVDALRRDADFWSRFVTAVCGGEGAAVVDDGCGEDSGGSTRRDYEDYPQTGATWDMMRPIPKTLAISMPFGCSWCCGSGYFFFRSGVCVSRTPWVCLAEVEPLLPCSAVAVTTSKCSPLDLVVSTADNSPKVTPSTPLCMFVDHNTAWNGSSCLSLLRGTECVEPSGTVATCLGSFRASLSEELASRSLAETMGWMVAVTFCVPEETLFEDCTVSLFAASNEPCSISFSESPVTSCHVRTTPGTWQSIRVSIGVEMLENTNCILHPVLSLRDDKSVASGSAASATAFEAFCKDELVYPKPLASAVPHSELDVCLNTLCWIGDIEVFPVVAPSSQECFISDLHRSVYDTTRDLVRFVVDWKVVRSLDLYSKVADGEGFEFCTAVVANCAVVSHGCVAKFVATLWGSLVVRSVLIDRLD